MADMGKTRRIKVEALSRVEGEGGLFVRLTGDVIDKVELHIFEPPRLFEALLRGRSLEEVPDITARICGICPVAYQMSSVHALEAALGVAISPEVRRLRRLLYCGEWIESHALHVHLLHAPDFLGYDSGIDLARDHPNEVKRGLRLKKHGNQLLEVLGGRAIHPINVAVGGFYKAPRRDEFLALIPDFEWGLEAAVETTRWVAGLDFPDFTQPYEMVAVVHSDEYGMNEGLVTSSSGQSWTADQYESAFAEEHVPRSTALQSVRKPQGTNYMVGPLARLNLSRERLSPRARQLADELKVELPCLNPFKAIIARGLELVHAYEESLDILRTYKPPQPPRVAYAHRAGEGCAATEAPRGLLYHRYVVDDAGHVTFATIIPPTSQNQRQIEDDLRAYLPQILKGDDQATALDCERLVRSYDPCISCSTHFLKVTLERG
jgi:coenzyme F420-reducing hydrogenase alpha subunit